MRGENLLPLPVVRDPKRVNLRVGWCRKEREVTIRTDSCATLLDAIAASWISRLGKKGVYIKCLPARKVATTPRVLCEI